MQNRPTHWNGVEVPYGTSVTELASLVQGPAPARWAAFVALAHTPGEPALAILAEHARSPDPHVRRMAVEAIGVHPDGRHMDAVVCSLLLDTHDFVARSACEAAARHRLAAAHDPIVKLLDARTESTRVAGLRALRELWRDADFERVFHAFTSETSADARSEAAWTLRLTAAESTWHRLVRGLVRRCAAATPEMGMRAGGQVWKP